jgi:predicted HTH domain antitoxin
MNVLEIPYHDNLPDLVQRSRTEFEQDLKMALAAKLFELGKISSGQAAELAGLPRGDFLKQLSRFQVAAIRWHPDEFEDELKNV